jgi:hypothetical protein
MMNGFDGFMKMQEIHKHLRQEAQWWQGEGLSPALIAEVFRGVARDLDSPRGQRWAERWEAARPKSHRAP